MKLYVVMPVVNCLEFTKDAIDSIQSPCTVIVIDNASTDGTRSWGESMNGEHLLYGKVLKYVRNDVPKGVAASWNQGIKLAFEDDECEYVAVLNNDIVLNKKTLPNMIAFMEKTGYLMVTGDNVKSKMGVENLTRLELPEPFTDFDTWKIEGWRAEGPDFSCFLINRETIRVIGWFDENYKGAYCEDQDYHVRCDRARRHIAAHNDQNIDVARVHFKRLSTAPYYHYASQTISRNESQRASIAQNHGHNETYRAIKWGASHPDAMDGGGNVTPFGNAAMNWRDW